MDSRFRPPPPAVLPRNPLPHLRQRIHGGADSPTAGVTLQLIMWVTTGGTFVDKVFRLVDQEDGPGWAVVHMKVGRLVHQPSMHVREISPCG